MEIDYSSISEWKKFVEDYVLPLKNSADVLLNYQNYIRGRVDEKSIDEVEKDEPMKIVLLGGVDEDGEYSERSLALFYKKFFGARLSNLQGYLISQKEGITSHVTAKVEESEFTKFIKSIFR
jgi:hypothetical protein